MIQRDFVKHDRLTQLYAVLQDGSGKAIDLLGQSILFYMVYADTKIVKVNGKAASIVDAELGEVSYTWEAADVDEVGKFWGYFVRVKDGLTGTHPIGEQLLIHIVPSPIAIASASTSPSGSESASPS
jgi:hypothetical protein